MIASVVGHFFPFLFLSVAPTWQGEERKVAPTSSTLSTDSPPTHFSKAAASLAPGQEMKEVTETFGEKEIKKEKKILLKKIR